MISKKNKALVAGILSAAMSATAVLPAMASAQTSPSGNSYASANDANDSYATMFSSLYDDVITNGEANGYLAKNNNGSGSFGIPYHSVEELCVEAPDYGHETTSEAMSYMVWMTSMHDVLVQQNRISGSTGDLQKGWKTLEAMIPGWSKNAYGSNTKYNTLWNQSRLKADTAEEGDSPEAYPTKSYANQGGGDAINPLYDAYKTAYGSDNGYYLMNWLADVDDWYGFGGGSGKFVFINTFQRGTQESCFETVPQPCLEELKYGMTGSSGDNGNGIKAIFNGYNAVPAQYSFTNAPDAEDRAVQAVYFANLYGVNTGELSALAGKMGDQCRNDMFDKYYKKIAVDTKITDSSAGMDSKHYLMSWYTSWGGALTASYGDYQWAWQIGCSHSHQFYQNPLAAYALITDSDINAGMKADNAQATKDYTESLKRQVEMYLWLQSVDGPIAGGCTNSYNGRYETYPSNLPTFYDMVYVAHPVYSDPGSNHWIGNQVWSVQRLAELYYYIKTNGDKSGVKPGGLSLEDALDAILSRWITWFEENTHFDWTDPSGNDYAYCIPSSLDWGEDDDTTDPNCVPDTWTGTYNPNGNQKLKATITAYGQADVGCISSLCNSLIYYAAAKGVDASAATTDDNTTVEAKGLRLANKLLSAQWDLGRDEIGIAFTDTNGSLKRVFEQEVYIPNYYNGTMPDGSKLAPGATFSSIRESYNNVDAYKEAKAYYEGNGTDNNGDGTVDINDYQFKLHRFWHAGDALMSYGTMALLYPDVKPDFDDDEPDDILWGDANCDGKVDLSDAVMILQSISNPDKYGVNGSSESHITAQGVLNGDVYANGTGLTPQDALSIQKYVAELITELPESYQ